MNDTASEFLYLLPVRLGAIQDLQDSNTYRLRLSLE